MQVKNIILSLVVILGLFLGNGAFHSKVAPVMAYIPDDLPAVQQIQNQLLATFPVIADFEGGVPTGWFVYGDWGNITIDITNPTIPDSDSLALPGQIGNNDVLSVTANIPTWAGFGAALNPAQDWSDYDAISLWYYGENLSTTHEVEIQTVSGDDRRATFVDDFVGWRQIVLPFSTFGVGGAYDVSQVDNWVFVLDGTVGSFKLDHLELVNLIPFADFESGVPADWFVYGDWGNITIDITNPTIPQSDPLSLPGQIGPNDILSVTASVPTWAGFGAALNPAADWSDMQGVSFWFYGENSGTTHAFEIQTVPGDDRRAEFVDDFVGWQIVTFPFATFGATPYDVSQVDNWVFVLDGTVGAFKIDQLSIYGDAGNITQRAQFQAAQYTVTEGDTVTITVTLNITTTYPVTVTYATADGTAVAGVDYISTTGTLVFPPDMLAQSFTVATIDNDIYAGNRTVNLILSDPVNVELGARDTAILTILEDELSNVCETRSLMINDFEDGNLPSGVDGDGLAIGFFTWEGPNATIDITTTLQVTNTVLQMDSNVPSGSYGGMTHHFTNEAVDSWVTQDWSTYEAISFWVYGTNSGETLLFEVQDNRNPGSTVDDPQIWSYPFPDAFTGWKQFVVMFDEFNMKDIGVGAPQDDFDRDQVHGWAFGSTGLIGTTYLDDVQVCGTAPEKPLAVAFERGTYNVTEGETAVLTVALSRVHTETVTVEYATAEANARPWQYTPVTGTLTFPAGTLTQTISIPTYHDGKHTRDVRVAVNLYEGNAPLGFQRRALLTIVDIDSADSMLIDDFEGYHPFIYQTGAVTLTSITVQDSDALAVPGQLAYEDVLKVEVDGAASFSRVFSQGQDWSASDGLSVWFYGQNSGETITLELRENMTATTAQVAPEDWVLVWSDEFDDLAGMPPNSNVWKYELGDGALNGIVGWGNSEFQYYTDNTDNSFMDGTGNLVIRLQDTAPDTDLVCWYGPCEYTSARLLTQDRLDFEYGRIEARVLVPDGPGGLWPAFWMLGTDIPDVGWPQSGEIDIMEYVSRLPNEIFGTIHGPGYAGGASFGNTLTFTEPVASEYHTYAVEWMPDHIIWYVDDIQYHQAIPADVAPNEWVFNHPFFMLLNAAIGGNFGGAIADDMTMPQDTLVDYVRVYQAADTAERFEATFTDDFTGWRKVFMPFDAFTRSAEPPAGAPDDGLTLTEVWGYGFTFPEGSAGTFHMDQVRLYTMHQIYLPIVIRN